MRKKLSTFPEMKISYENYFLEAFLQPTGHIKTVFRGLKPTFALDGYSNPLAWKFSIIKWILSYFWS